MLPLFMWLLVVSIILSCIAVLPNVRIRQRQSRHVEVEPPVENSPSYSDDNLVSASFCEDVNPADSGLPPSIVQSDVERLAWVRRMTSHVFTKRHKGLYNVVVINDDLEYHLKPEGVVEKFSIKFHNSKRPWTVPYLVMVFRNGTLLNLGDGGDINWDWQGNFTRSGNKLLTFKPCVSGVHYKQDAWNAL